MLFAALAFFYTAYFMYSWAVYHHWPASKRDLHIRTIITSRFPSGYDVSIRTADLVGLGDKFYVAWANPRVVAPSYLSVSEKDDAGADSDVGSRPGADSMLRLFHEKDLSPVKLLVTHLPVGDLISQLPEWTLEEYYALRLRPGDPACEPTNEPTCYSKPPLEDTFTITSVEVRDLDDDSRDEIRVEWLLYFDGSGGTRWSTILEFVGDRLSVSSGYPDVYDIEVLKSALSLGKWASASDRRRKATREDAEDILDLLACTNAERKRVLDGTASFKDILNIVESHRDRVTISEPIWDAEHGAFLRLAARHTDDYSKLLKVGESVVLVDAFYFDDDSCHWCEHSWYIQAFQYRDGRWISDRMVNGDWGLGQELDPKRRYTINEIHGTLAVQGMMGLAGPNLRPDQFLQADAQGMNAMGVEARRPSPVDSKVMRLYRMESSL